MGVIAERYRALKSAQKVPTGVPAYMLWANRPAGRMVAAAAPGWMTPNGLTVTSGILTYGALIALWLVPIGSLWGGLIGIVLAAGFILDSADGQLSRLRGGGSPLGEWLDHVVDAGKIALLHMSVAVYFVRNGLDVASLAWPALFLVAATLIYAGGLLVDKVRAAGAASRAGTASARRAILMLPVDYGILCLTFLLVPWPQLFIPVYIALAIANALFLVAYLTKWLRELQAAVA